MSIIVRPKLPPYQRSKPIKRSTKKQRMISQTIVKDLPRGTELLENQVAGHTFQIGTDEIGMLKDQQDGSVLKAAVKPICGLREIKFYEELMRDSTEPSIEHLRKLVPEYRGTVKMSFRGKVIDFIKLADITHDMDEPCVMDIKIGKRTWDPEATKEKILAEEQKYEACKQNLGICIPGFQVYDIKTDRIRRFGKEYGKKLDQNTVKDALKIFLNADTQMSRLLLTKFLTTLWSIQSWARSQTSLRLYSSSLLLAYDAKRLKTQIFSNRNHSNSSTVSSRSSSVDSSSKLTPTSSSGNEWQPSHTNTANEINTNLNGCTNSNNSNGNNSGSGGGGGGVIDHTVTSTQPIQFYKKLQRSHSTQNNYEEDMKHICKDYDFYLDNLMDECNASENREWAFVKMIDFAHVFPAEDASIDTNYFFGIENLVKIFEEFLRECDQ
ncbi:inositol polyphosphate multikinase isoform X2 [Contarinia nasturtii]|uniref:inositol polyphosphate multikinase isoform X2 n=1 Tax=Contarinia nasturtii TaxID=265458 RepID=UPI0012D44B0E|nr:inositol polyphosphate multikinase isoform X2 [Contarinia nasturtii]